MTKSRIKKIDRIKKQDRVKIVDRPDLLMVHPLTHAASIRYGHKSKWCTATGNSQMFNDYNKKGVLIYIIIYDLNDEGKRGEVKTKVAISKSSRSRTWKSVHCYDRFDRYLNIELLQALILKSDFKKLTEYLGIEEGKGKNGISKQQTREFSLGDIVSCSGDRNVLIKYMEYDEEGWGKHLKKTSVNRWRKTAAYKKRHYQKFGFGFIVKKDDILKAKVVAINTTSIDIQPIEIKGVTPIQKQMLQSHFVKVRINMTIKERVSVLVSNKGSEA